MIENLFAVRKTKFADHPGVIPELDLVDDDDKITHEIELSAELEPNDACNNFKVSDTYLQEEEEWEEIKK